MTDVAQQDDIPGDVYGLELTQTPDGVRSSIETRKDKEGLDEWLKAFPENPDVKVRILCVRLNDDFDCSPASFGKLLKTPFLSSIVDTAVWGSEIYHALVDNPGGGAAGLVDNPWRFILRTPDDGGPFCSLASSRKGIYVKALYLYNADVFDLAKIDGGQQKLAAWRYQELNVATPAHRYACAQSALSSSELARIVAQVSDVERALERATELPHDYPRLSRILNSSNGKLVDIERRSRFETSILDAIESLAVEIRNVTAPWPGILPLRTRVSARTFDFETLPRRIENARAAIDGLIQQRNAQLNLELAQSSERIAEATFSDSKSMKTIAILTMVFLPGTAVASLFSMSMFDWSNSDGDGLASKWLWVYFVVSVPLTGVVLGIWWLWGRRAEQASRRVFAARANQRAMRYVDVEAGPSLERESEEIEMQSTKPVMKSDE